MIQKNVTCPHIQQQNKLAVKVVLHSRFRDDETNTCMLRRIRKFIYYYIIHGC